MFGWLRRKRRAKIRQQPFPQEWLPIIEANFSHWPHLTAEEQTELKGHIQVFLAEKFFEGCGGQEMTDEIRVTITANACLLLLHRETDYFPKMKSVLVYPSEFFADIRQRGSGGFIVETEQGRLGESWYRGPVVLSWDAVTHGAADPSDGHNVVLHEFAHQLDSESGAVNGAPVLDDRDHYDDWARVLGAEFHTLIERMHAHRGSDIRGYGATSPAEFFAVVTECFFEKPHQLQKRHPELYEQFKAYYRQDPAGRTDG